MADDIHLYEDQGGAESGFCIHCGSSDKALHNQLIIDLLWEMGWVFERETRSGGVDENDIGFIRAIPIERWRYKTEWSEWEEMSDASR